MRFPFRLIAAGGIAAIGIASALIHPFGDVKGSTSSKLLLPGTSTDIAVLRIFERSCQSCHSQKTHWPWYSYIAPASWMIEHDVHYGRSHLNLSRWNDYSIEERREILSAMGAAVRNRLMPLPRYLHLHPEARLSDAEIDRVYRWTKSARRRLRIPEASGAEKQSDGCE